MNKPIIYSEARWRAFDMLSGWNDMLVALGILAGDCLAGSAGASVPPVVTGFTAAPGSGLSVALGPGVVYALAALDAANYGPLGTNTALVIHQGAVAVQTVQLTTSGLSSGQSQWALIEVAYAQVDDVAASDPDGGILPYYNSANPSIPLYGPAGSGGVLNTERRDTATIRVLYGAPSSGTPVTPAPDSGYLPLYYVLLTYGQTSLTQGAIYPGYLASGSLAGGYVAPPFVTGMTRPVAKQTVAATVQNTTTATALWQALIPPGTLAPTSTLRLRAAGTLLNNTGAAQTVALDFNIGTTTVLTTGAVSFGANASAVPWVLDAQLTCAGSLTSQFVDGTARFGPPGDTGGTMGTQTALVGTGTAAANFGANQTLALFAALGTASTSLQCVLARATLELVP
jgi:hypothetical protein